MNDGFIWNGMHSEEFGLICSSLPGKGAPERMVDKIEIPGRDGFLTVDHGTYKGDVKSVSFHLIDETQVDRIQGWLKGSGEVIFSNFPDRYYKAVIISKIELSQVLPVLHKGVVQFDCQPFGYLLDGLEPFEVSIPGSLHNPGNHTAHPYFKVFGSGEIVLRINGDPFTVKNIEEYVEIDGELDTVHKSTISWENKSSGEIPQLIPGENSISWTGNVSRIEIVPHWRCV